MSSLLLPSPQQNAPIDDGEDVVARYELLPHQWEELFDRTHPLLYVIGGRGSGKSWVNWLHFFIKGERCVDQPYGLFANTDSQLHAAIVGPITAYLDLIDMAHVFESKAPEEWYARWERDEIRTPPRNLRNPKMWIWEDGTHIFLGTLANNSYTRVKSLDLAFALIEEATEPGIEFLLALRTIIGAVRCGVAKKDRDGGSECKRRGHFHQTIVKGNDPLMNPRHPIYRDVEQKLRAEEKRIAAGKAPYFRLITPTTFDNPHTGEEYVERLRGALDEATFKQQTAGGLRRNTAATTYYSFSEANILDTLTYDPLRPLHIWFDFNHRPATAGWGHDLRMTEVPTVDQFPGYDYFGIHGELFSGVQSMQTEQVAYALLEDPTRDARAAADSRCVETACNHRLSEHVELDPASGWLCRVCAYERPVREIGLPGGVVYCKGTAASIDELSLPGAGGLIHAPANWRGLFHHRANIYVYGDASGKATHADASQGGGSRGILKDIFMANLGERVHMRYREANPPIVRRLLSMNRSFRDQRGIHRLFIAPWCTEHVADFREVVPDPKSDRGEPLKVSYSERSADEYWMRTHSSDGCGYHNDFRWPAVIPSMRLPDAGGMAEIEDERDSSYGPFASLGKP